MILEISIISTLTDSFPVETRTGYKSTWVFFIKSMFHIFDQTYCSSLNLLQFWIYHFLLNTKCGHLYNSIKMIYIFVFYSYNCYHYNLSANFWSLMRTEITFLKFYSNLKVFFLMNNDQIRIHYICEFSTFFFLGFLSSSYAQCKVLHFGFLLLMSLSLKMLGFLPFEFSILILFYSNQFHISCKLSHLTGHFSSSHMNRCRV